MTAMIQGRLDGSQMGSDRLANEVAAVKQHQQRHSALVMVVDAQWLRACSAACGRADEDAYVLGLAALMPSTHVHGREVACEQGNRGSSRSAWDGEPCHATAPIPPIPLLIKLPVWTIARRIGCYLVIA